MADDTVSTSGPLFDGRAYIALHGGIEAVRHQVAERGRQLTMAAFTSSIREDRGRFQQTITTTDHSRTYSTHSGHKTYSMSVAVDDVSETVVTTSLATYGPWLEGVGSRNLTTRFKGYHGFRKAGQELERAAQNVADAGLYPYVEQMN
jgi:hypothetical protein